ncbi:MAG TPA: hypothetical protein VLC98_02410 [Phnomibacter sp.]|nr:hypothetical protein [Phnomibacter sp.]
MMKFFRILPLILMAMPCSMLLAQDVTGIWRGTFYNEYEYLFNGSKYRYEVQIKNVGKAVKGVTYSYQTTRFYGKTKVIGMWASGSGDLTLKEDQMTDLKVTGGGDACLMTCYLRYRKDGVHEYLEGTYTSVNMKNDTIPCGGGVVRLEKVQDSDFEVAEFLKSPDSNAKANGKSVKPGQSEFLVTKPTTGNKPPAAGNNSTNQKKSNPVPEVKDTPNKTVGPVTKPKEETPSVTAKAPPIKTDPPKVLTTRKNEIVETIVTDAKTLEVSFYDNGEIDGDTISVYSNNKLVVSKKGLSADAITIKVAIDENEPIQEVVMVAENLGSIPPNTALMIVQAGAKRYTVRLASTEQKNAVVRFKFDPDALK